MGFANVSTRTLKCQTHGSLAKNVRPMGFTNVSTRTLKCQTHGSLAKNVRPMGYTEARYDM
jgi:hypothetical protein